MPKDYARKARPKKRGASRKAKKNKVPVSMWLFTFLVVGGLVAGLSYLKLAPKKSQPNPIEPAAEAKGTNTKNDQQAKTEDYSDVPIYNIHDTLTNKEVEIPEEDLKPSEDLNKYVYLMPCGSFRESFRAEELKATIAMTGNTSSINAVKSNGETWYRVELGPYPRKRKAENVRHRLQDNGVHDCQIIPRLKN